MPQVLQGLIANDLPWLWLSARTLGISAWLASSLTVILGLLVATRRTRGVRTPAAMTMVHRSIAISTVSPMASRVVTGRCDARRRNRYSLLVQRGNLFHLRVPRGPRKRRDCRPTCRSWRPSPRYAREPSAIGHRQPSNHESVTRQRKRCGDFQTQSCCGEPRGRQRSRRSHLPKSDTAESHDDVVVAHRPSPLGPKCRSTHLPMWTHPLRALTSRPATNRPDSNSACECSVAHLRDRIHHR